MDNKNDFYETAIKYFIPIFFIMLSIMPNFVKILIDLPYRLIKL